MTSTPEHITPDLVDLAPAMTTSRRSLLRHGVALGLAAPFVLPSRRSAAQDEHGHGEESTPEADDHASVEDAHTEAPVASGPVQPFRRFDPFLTTVESGAKDITMVAQDATVLIAKDVAYAGWTYGGTIPGPALRVVEGDTVNVTFRVDAAANAHHSLDFHSAKTPPDVNFRTMNPGEELSWSFVATHPGAYMYHCGDPKILMHIGSGLYGR